MSGLCSEEPLEEGKPCSWAGDFRVAGGVPSHALQQGETQGCWENPELRSTLVQKLPQLLVLLRKPNKYQAQQLEGKMET